jgi:hypothetical protein
MPVRIRTQVQEMLPGNPYTVRLVDNGREITMGCKGKAHHKSSALYQYGRRNKTFARQHIGSIPATCFFVGSEREHGWTNCGNGRTRVTSNAIT